jgi:hypothetical protein
MILAKNENGIFLFFFSENIIKRNLSSETNNFLCSSTQQQALFMFYIPRKIH